MMEKKVLCVTKSDGERFGSSLGLQAGLDYLGGIGGGILQIGEGVWQIESPLRLPSRVHVRGASGGGTILKLAPQRSSPLVRDADLHESIATVEDASFFAPGQGVFFSEPGHLSGFADSIAVVSRRDGNVLYLDREITLTYQREKACRLVTGGSILTAESVEDIELSDLVLDGNKAECPIGTGGCVAGGIYFFRSRNVSITDVTVRDYHGDGVTYQHCENVNLLRVKATGCTAIGIHPGSGTTGTSLIECEANENGADGFYFCWRVTQGIVERCRAIGNARSGFSIGHKDEHNVIRDSVFSNNAYSGILFRNEPIGSSADNNLFERNEIMDNGGARDCGYAGVRVLGYTNQVTLRDNLIRFSDPAVQKQSCAFVLGAHAHDITIEGNRYEGCAREMERLE